MSRREDGGRSAGLRWAAATAAALGLHAAALAVLIRTAAPDPLAAGGGDAIAVELDPVEGDSAKPDEAKPAVPADEATTASAPAADAAASQAAPPPQTPVPPTPPPPDPAPPAPAPPPLDPPPPPEPSPPPEPPPVPVPPPSAAVPDIAAPPPPPVEARPDPLPAPPRPVTPPVPASQASAAAAASEDAAPVQRRLSSARVAAWRGKLVPHLNRYRSFPPGLRGGTARVGFTIDAEGRVTAVAVVTSSGDPALDAAARDLVERSSPFPAPPPGVTGRDLSFVVPVHYDARP